jgi:hypothetical protein
MYIAMSSFGSSSRRAEGHTWGLDGHTWGLDGHTWGADGHTWG